MHLLHLSYSKFSTSNCFSYILIPHNLQIFSFLCLQLL
nr:MAG TPA: hypothetical protein [Caudoviricetes sp.]